MDFERMLWMICQNGAWTLENYVSFVLRGRLLEAPHLLTSLWQTLIGTVTDLSFMVFPVWREGDREEAKIDPNVKTKIGPWLLRACFGQTRKCLVVKQHPLVLKEMQHAKIGPKCQSQELTPLPRTDFSVYSVRVNKWGRDTNFRVPPQVAADPEECGWMQKNEFV